MVNFFQFYTFLTVFICFLSNISLTQIIFEQDICNCGVTGDGFSTNFANDTGVITLNISPTATIRKAYLFYNLTHRVANAPHDLYLDVEKPSSDIFINSTSINLQNGISTSSEFFSVSLPTLINSDRILYQDITSVVNPATNIYTLVSSDLSVFEDYYYSNYYLFVVYESNLLQKMGYTIVVNNQNSNPFLNFPIDVNNQMEASNDIGLALNTLHICSPSLYQDGSYVFINNNNIGLIGGSENNSPTLCSSSRATFNYQDGALTSNSSSDNVNNIMSGTDVIALLNPYLTDFDSVNVRYQYQSLGDIRERTNNVLEHFLTYTTPCDTFSVSTPNDTTVCYGAQLQLNASGGQSYEWLPSTGLSCNTCPNPVFTADSTMHYTVRIWNNDSCSVVKPVQIIVSRPEIDNVSFVSPDCGTNNGQLTISGSSFSWLPVSYSIDNGALQTDSVFANLAEGTYLLSLEDAAGCTADTTVFLQSVNNTVAQFNTSAGGTEVPVTVWGENTSQNATNYEWFVNGTFFSNSQDILPVFNNTGAQTIMLIAWQYDPTCADTAYAQIVIQNELVVPTAFTPDNDGINDFWEILYLDEVYPDNQVFVYNRWGNLIYTSTKGDYAGRPWRGGFENLNPQGKELPVGSYFYVIETGVSATLDNPSSETFHNPNASETAAEALEAKLRGSVTVVR